MLYYSLYWYIGLLQLEILAGEPNTIELLAFIYAGHMFLYSDINVWQLRLQAQHTLERVPDLVQLCFGLNIVHVYVGSVLIT